MRSLCPACSSSHTTALTASERMLGLGGNFEYLECQSCGSLWIKSIPSDLSAYYPANYYAFQAIKPDKNLIQKLKRIRYQISKVGFSFLDNEYLQWIKNLRTHENESIADIGCGNGNLLWQLNFCGFKNLQGFDPFIPQEFDSPSLKIKKLPLSELKGKFDVLMFHHSFEHFEDPIESFAKISEILNPGGRALIRLPVTDGLVWKQEREFWFQLDAPRHLFIPSVAGMEMLGKKFGLKLEKVEFDSLGNQFWGTELYKKGGNYADFNLLETYSKSELKEFERKAQILNAKKQGDQAAFYFKK
jgi:SAM-dependent methyltransferase